MSLCFLLVCVLFLSVPARAAELDSLLDTGALTGELPASAGEFIPGASPGKLPDKGVFRTAADKVGEMAAKEWASVSRTAGILLLVCLFYSISRSADADGRVSRYVTIAGVAAVGAASMADLDSYLQTGLRSLQELSDYSRVLLPVLTTAASASGSVTAAGAKYAATALAMDVLLSLSRNVALPLAGGYAALALADAAVGNDVLKAAKKLMKWACVTLAAALATGFTAWLSLTGIAAGAADTLAARMTKSTLSAALPVLGSILADAAGSLTAAAGMLRSTVGIFGLLAVLGICLAGMIPLAVRYLVYKLSAAVCSCLADRRMGELIGDLGACFGLILAVNAAGGLMMFISVYSLMRTVLP
ncbi:MAG: hypothetical protein IJH47_00030 [Oscillospiraceae bacterium]|nr:hypothetical protein [Oscillospiraceae bacterium]